MQREERVGESVQQSVRSNIMMSDETTHKIVVASLALYRVRGISQRKVIEAIRVYGGAMRAIEMCDSRTPELQAVLPLSAEVWQWAENEYSFCCAHGIEAITYEMSAYPPRLKVCPDAPVVLFFKGNVSLQSQHMISVVGTRHITEYGKDMCRHMLRELSSKVPDALIVSGLAYGVDIHAHREALANGLNTIAVLAHGLDRIYPALHRDTARSLCTQGGLLTEYPVRTRPDRPLFVQRNRIVAAMSEATIVVESAEKGGALITAKKAVEYGREVLACPGRCNDEYSRGCNNLIAHHGARLLTCADDIIHALQWKVNKTQSVVRELFPVLTPEEERLIGVLKTVEYIAIEELALRLSLPYTHVNMLVQSLELRHLVKMLPGARVRVL